jgi:prepilin-type processing-associated H-X9-DG protein
MKHRARLNRRRSGSFGRAGVTMVELLVAVGIVALLAGLVAPALTSAKRNAMAGQSTNNLRQLTAANLAYAADQGTYVPADSRNNLVRWCASRRNLKSAFDPAKGLLSPYLGSEGRIATCPFLKEALGGNASFEEGAGGYGYNAQYVGGRPDWGYDSNGLRLAERPANIERTSGTVMFATTAFARADGVQEYPFAEPPYWDFGDGPSEWRPSPSVHFRVNGKALVAWCDGHVTAEAPEERPEGTNPYGGVASEHALNWFGPDAENGFWNPRRINSR